MKIANAQIDSYIKRIAQEKIAGCLLFGPESSVATYRFNLIAPKIVTDLSDPFLVSNISKERLAEDKSLLIDEYYSMSFLGGRKLIIIKDTDINTGSALKNLFSDKEFSEKSDNFILIQAGDLDKSSALRKAAESNPNFAAIACYEDNEGVIKRFIEDELIKREIKSNFQITSYICDKCSKNRQSILSELDKISSYLGENKELTAEIIDKVIGCESDISATEFISSYSSKQFNLALIQSEKLFKNGFEPIVLIRFLSNYLQKLYQAKCQITFAKVDFETAVKSQRLFFKTEIEFRKNLKLLSLGFLAKNLQNLEDLENKIKISSLSSKALFIAFVQNSSQN